MNAEDEIKILTDLVDKFRKSAASYTANVVNGLVADGNIAAIEYMFDNKMIDGGVRSNLAQPLRNLPVLMPQAFGADQADPERKERWERRFGKPSVSSMSSALASCRDEQAADNYLAAGADPLYADGDGLTPVFMAIHQSVPAVARKLLRHCLDRDRVPLSHPTNPETGQGLFEQLVGLSYAPLREEMFDAFADEISIGNLGSNCREELIRLLVQKRTRGADSRDIAPRPLMNLLKLAIAVKPSSEQWMAIADSFTQPAGTFFQAIAARWELAEIACEAVRSLSASGVDVLSDLSAIQKAGEIRSPLVPMLHVAARADNKSMVSLLLELGANPNQRVPFGRPGRERNAIELAPEGGATAILLAAWSAKQAMQRVVATHAKPSPH